MLYRPVLFVSLAVLSLSSSDLRAQRPAETVTVAPTVSPEPTAAQKIEAQLAQERETCKKQKLDLLNSFVSDLKSLEKPITDLRTKYEGLRDQEMKE